MTSPKKGELAVFGPIVENCPGQLVSWHFRRRVVFPINPVCDVPIFFSSMTIATSLRRYVGSFRAAWAV